MRLVAVAIPVPSLDLLTYLIPDSVDVPPIGARVLVPVGTRRMTGIVVRTEARRDPVEARPHPVEAGSHNTNHTGDGLRAIIDVIDDDAFLPEHIVDLTAWLAEYYACGPGEAMAAAMPPFAWIESERAAQITEAGLEALKRRAPAGQDSLVVHGSDLPNAPGSAQGFSRAIAEPGSALAVLRILASGRAVPLRVLAQRVGRHLDAGARPPVSSLVPGLQYETSG